MSIFVKFTNGDFIMQDDVRNIVSGEHQLTFYIDQTKYVVLLRNVLYYHHE